ncbi:2257_t:CDS:2 [Ambispora leptoticha]|uniref:2257_t:CDS:1 n=1 Tax=Ambispora leptoticha TaxID=144679 RepID=A0A9N9EL21_9GLOM|nr:2257_t:CDS:2 [Ambispora leptoticha]
MNHPTDSTTKFLKSILGVNTYYMNGPPPLTPSSHVSPSVDIASQIDRDNHTNSITAPIPRSANSNVNIAALDPELQLRRNSILNLFTAVDPSSSSTTTTNATNTNTTTSSRRPSVPAVTTTNLSTNTTTTTDNGNAMQERQEQMLNFLQQPSSAVSLINMNRASSSTVNDNSATTLNNAITNNNNHGWFSMFVQQPSSHHHPLVSPYHHQYTATAATAVSLYSSQGYATPMAQQHVGFVGQGRPHNHQSATSNTGSNNNGFNNISYLNNRDSIDDVSRKMSLLGLLSSSESDSSNPASVRNSASINSAIINNDDVVKQQSASSLPLMPSTSYFTDSGNGGDINGLSGANILSTNGIINQNPAPPQINNNNNTINHNTHHPQRSFTPGTPTAHRASHENLLRLITASPPPQTKFASSGPIDAEIQEQERTLMSFLKFAGSENLDVGNADNHATSNNNDNSTTASIGSAGSSTTTIANELNVVGDHLDTSSLSYNMINSTREIHAANNIFSSNTTGKNVSFLDVLPSTSSSYPLSNNNINNSYRNQHDYFVGNINDVVDITSIPSMGVVDQQQLLLQQLLNNNNHHLPHYYRRHDNNNYVSGAGGVGNSFNISEVTATTSTSAQIPAFTNFKFDVDKILAAM